MLPFLNKGFGINWSDSLHTDTTSENPGMSTCTFCGGSGIQRVSSQRFRTCQACLGTGRITTTIKPAPLSKLTTADLSISRLDKVPQNAS